MDVIGTPEREPRTRPAWLGRGAPQPAGRRRALPGAAVAALVGAVVAGAVLVGVFGVGATGLGAVVGRTPGASGSPSPGDLPAVAQPLGPQPAPLAPGAPSPATPGPPDLGIRGVGGDRTVEGAGVRGTLEVEVRNGSRTVRLAGLTAEVPGVRFVPRTPPNGATLVQDGLVRLELGYVVDDCARLGQDGRIVFTLLEPRGLVDLVLPVLDEQGGRRQSALDRVLDACKG